MTEKEYTLSAVDADLTGMSAIARKVDISNPSLVKPCPKLLLFGLIELKEVLLHLTCTFCDCAVIQVL